MSAFVPASARWAFLSEPHSAKDGDLGYAERPRVITLCGSTRFMDEFERVNHELTLRGHVVFSVALKAYEGSGTVSEKQKAILDQVHLEKIRLSDEIFVINVGGYIGPSTEREIQYANRIGKTVRYFFEATEGAAKPK